MAVVAGLSFQLSVLARTYSLLKVSACIQSHVCFDTHAVQVGALSGSRSVLWGSGLLAVVLQSWQPVPALGSACIMSRVCHNSCLHAHVRFDNHAVQVGAISGSRSVLWGS